MPFRSYAAGFCFIALAILAVYANSLAVPFQLDGINRIAGAEELNTLNPAAVFEYSKSRFVPFYTLALNRYFGGQDVLGYHLVNLLIHFLASCAVFLLAYLIFLTPPPGRGPADGVRGEGLAFAVVAGLIFAVHPIQTEAVTYIYQRSESMAGLFMLLALLCYTIFRKDGGGRRTFYWLSLAAAVAAFFSKPSAVILPLVLVLWELFFLSRDRAEFSQKAGLIFPFFLLAVLPLWAMSQDPYEIANAPVAARGAEIGIRLGPEYLPYYVTKLKVLMTALGLMVLPLNQTIDYHFAWSRSLADMPALISLLALMALIATAVWARRKAPFFSFAVLFFFITLLPMTLLYMGDLFFEHYLYTAVFGWALWIAAMLGRWSGRGLKVPALAVACALASGYGFTAHQRNAVWADGISLWQDAAGKAPNKVRPHYILGVHYFWEGRLDEAFAEYKKVLDLKPDYPPLHFRLGEYYAKKGEPVLAISSYGTALLFNPYYFDAHLNAGILYADMGRFDRASHHLKRARETVKNESDRSKVARVVKALNNAYPGKLIL